MIARLHRFHGYNALNFVYRKGKTARASSVALRYVPVSGRGAYRLAVVVSKKVSKSAVVRNRIRRRLYEEARVVIPSGAPYDLVLTVFDSQLATMPSKDIRPMMLKLLDSAVITVVGPQPRNSQ